MICQSGTTSVSCNTTLLDYIRNSVRLTGTKEGCAEGDCGACTVLVGRLLRGELVYETVNACIRPLPTVHACHIVTVEYLAGKLDSSASLHPVQQAIADNHGSQCGFCTPGFVMSLYALWLDNPEPDNTAIERALQGNLCRCTGYQPLVDAARDAARNTAPNLAGDTARESTPDTTRVITRANDELYVTYKEIAQRLDGIEKQTLQTFTFEDQMTLRPADTMQLCEVLSEYPDATLLAGSTDVGLWINKEFKNVSPLVSIGHLEALHQISHDENGLTFGACTTYSEAASALLLQYPQLEDYWYRIGGEQVRNMGTIGGNIANGSPIGDTPPLFIAMGASVRLCSESGSRDLLLEDYFVEYGVQDRHDGEFIESIHIPAPVSHTLLSAYKISKRRDEDISAVCCGLSVSLQDDRVRNAVFAFGGMAGTPARAVGAEVAVIGEVWNEAAVEQACIALSDDFTPLSDWRASAGYRRKVAANLLRRFYHQHQADPAQGPVQLIRTDRADSAPGDVT